MSFASAEYPIFLIAVFFIYLLTRSRGALGLALRLLLLLLLGDAVYLLLAKDPGRLWDPLGGLFFHIVTRDHDRLPLVQFVVGAPVMTLAWLAGRRFGARLAGDGAQKILAYACAVVIVVLGASILGAHLAHRLDRMTSVFVGSGHLIFLVPYALAVGAGGRFGRLLVLFLVSAIFYHSWAAEMPGAYKYLLLVIVGTITLDYWLALGIDATDDPIARKGLLILSLVSNLGILAVFKYFDFFFGVGWKLILPAGISFHTFQSLSYTIDVYKRQIKPTRSIVTFATFVLFFPQLVAGPIVRAHEFLPQLEEEDRWTVDERASDGMFRIAIGLVKKIAFADFLAIQLADAVFQVPQRFSGLEVLVGVWAYALRIYFDFSAYSDIAIGSAQLLGFEFPENFRTPYRSANLQEFWRRWHITLSSWLRDYLYIALGGSRGASWMVYRNLFITMLLGGLWHGASWCFIAWGALHGGGLAVTRIWQRLYERDPLRARKMWFVALAVAIFGAIAHVRLGHHLPKAFFVHLILGWAYLTPLWAATTAWLSANDEPPLREVARRLPLERLVSLFVIGGLGAAVFYGVRPLWLPLVVLAFALAMVADLLERPPTTAWLAWAGRRAIATLLTFQYVCFAWIFFRAPTFDVARRVLGQIGTRSTDALNLRAPLLLALGVGALAHFYPPRTFEWLRKGWLALPPYVQAALLVALAFGLRAVSRPTIVPFIYFQF